MIQARLTREVFFAVKCVRTTALYRQLWRGWLVVRSGLRAVGAYWAYRAKQERACTRKKKSAQDANSSKNQ